MSWEKDLFKLLTASIATKGVLRTTRFAICTELWLSHLIPETGKVELYAACNKDTLDTKGKDVITQIAIERNG